MLSAIDIQAVALLKSPAASNCLICEAVLALASERRHLLRDGPEGGFIQFHPHTSTCWFNSLATSLIMFSTSGYGTAHWKLTTRTTHPLWPQKAYAKNHKAAPSKTVASVSDHAISLIRIGASAAIL